MVKFENHSLNEQNSVSGVKKWSSFLRKKCGRKDKFSQRLICYKKLIFSLKGENEPIFLCIFYFLKNVVFAVYPFVKAKQLYLD